jgi:hypothetical protein
MFSSVNGGCSWISSSGTSQGGPSLMFSIVLTSIFFSIDDGHSRISVTALKGGCLFNYQGKNSKKMRGKKMLAPPTSSLPPPRWARGPLSVP